MSLVRGASALLVLGLAALPGLVPAQGLPPHGDPIAVASLGDVRASGSLPRATTIDPAPGMVAALRAQTLAAPPGWSAPGGFALVELPPQTEPSAAAPRRPRHALRMRSDLAESAVRSLGIDATECDMLFRVNSRMTSGAGGTSLVLKPQMHLACRF